MRFIKKNFSTIILVSVFITGLSLLLYPTFSDYWNSFHQSRAIAEYIKQTGNLEEETYKKNLKEAKRYNKALFKSGNSFSGLTEKEREKYMSRLNLGTNGLMGYIEVPSIRMTLPIYHTTDDPILQIGVGHLEWSSLPVGGKNTHCVLSGHRGLPSARLFTDIDRMVVGDEFYLNVMNDTYAYRVDQINIVLPEEMGGLQITEGEDLCSLVTCTPYGVNTHRLIVRGHRIEYKQNRNIRITADAMVIDRFLIAIILGSIMIVLLLIWVMIHYRKKKE